MPESSEKTFTRRQVVVAGGAGVAGLVVGGVVGNALGSDDKSTGSTEKSGGASTTKPIVVGCAVPITGYLASDGGEFRSGTQMAIDEINEAGGIFGRKLVLEVEDIEDLAADKVVAAFQRLVEKGSSLLTLNYADPTFTEFDLIAKSGIPFFHVSTKITASDLVANDLKKYGNIFQWGPNQIPYGYGVYAYLTRLQDDGIWSPKKKTVAIIATVNPYSLTIADAFQSASLEDGWKTVLFEKVTPPFSEWGPVLAKIRAENPDVILFLDNYPADAAAFTKAFAAAPTKSLLYEQYAPSVPQYLELTGDTANGVLWAVTIGLLPDEIGTAWAERFRTKYGKEPGKASTPYSYDMIMGWRRCVALAESVDDFEAVCAEARKLIYRGNCGTLSFDPKNQTCRSYPGTRETMTMDASLGMPFQVNQVQDMEHKIVSPAPYAVSDFQTPPWLS